eukprot:GHUV01012129.1.p1 GENE.GHUV01012129.1~~GHUV01012129.1.p1  ORF type:complete len:337 (+),score=69.82 GHUV01012129.1:937-1947(+)
MACFVTLPSMVYVTSNRPHRYLCRQHEQQQAWKQREARLTRQPSSIYDSYDNWQPPRPVCPVPGASPSPISPMDSSDYSWDGRAYVNGVPVPIPKASSAVPDFTAILDAAQTGDMEHHLMDSYALRHLILSRPAELLPLSCMMLTPQLFLQRCQSTSLWGEKCVLTFTLKLRSEQELRSGYSKHPHKEPWVLARVSGEPVSAEPLEAISPEHPPEAVVAAQVKAFKDCDFDVAYALTSPVGRAVAGTRERFKAAMQSDFRYQPILAHKHATSLHRTHSNASTYLEVFSVQSYSGNSNLFIWVAVRQLEGLYKNCWLVEYVTPIKDPEFIKALQIGL